jgi:hypothetical protein
MSELDPVVQEILLKGDDQLLSALGRVGQEGAEHLNKLAEAAAGGAEPLNLLADKILYIGAAISGITAAMIAFIEQQTELSQKTILLADAFGTTAGQLQQLEQIFASSGVKVEQFERFANRLTITIAREWPQIAESIKNYANQNDSATLRVSSAILRIRDAQNALGDNSADRASRMAKDNASIEASYIKLQFAAQHAMSEQVGAMQAVQAAQLSVTAAEQHLAELEGRPPSKAEKENLAIAQAQQAVDSARKAEADARVAQQETAANASLKRAQMEQEYDDLSRKAAKNARDDAEARQKDENAVKEAIIARGEAEQKAAKLAVTNIVSIRDALKGIVDGNKEVAKSIDFSEVSVVHLTEGIMALAKETAKGVKPTGYETMAAISKVFANDTEHLIDQQQRLAIVNKLSGTSMQAMGVSASETLYALEHNSEAILTLTKDTDHFGEKVPPKSIEEFRSALAKLNLAISQMAQALAAAAAPAFTAFLEAIHESLTSNTGVLHSFVEGIKSIGSAVSAVISGWVTIEAAISHAFNLEPGTVFKAFLLVLAGIVAAFATSWAAIPIAITLVVTAIGELATNWEKVKAELMDNAVVRFWERLRDVVAKVKSLLSGNGWKNPAGGSAGGSAGANGSSSAGPETVAEAPISRAGGGEIDGPGTGTSDSIMARLSRGEFVQRAAAVQHYGVDFMKSINSLSFPGFATGGLVPSPIRMAGGGSVPATSTLNLSIDGRAFNGLRGPKSTVDDLSSFAIARQTSAAGNNPSWMK